MQSAMSRITTAMVLALVLSLGVDLLLEILELGYLNEQTASTFMVTHQSFNGFGFRGAATSAVPLTTHRVFLRKIA